MSTELLVDPLDVQVRIEELKRLHDGWLDGKGIAPPHAGLDWLALRFEHDFTGDSILPYLFPTPEGNILAEWSLKPWAISLEIDLQTRTGLWHALNLETDVELREELDLSGSAGWTWLSKQIEKQSGVVE